MHSVYDKNASLRKVLSTFIEVYLEKQLQCLFSGIFIGGGRPRHQGAMPRLKFEPEQEVTSS